MKTHGATEVANAAGRHTATITRWALAGRIPYTLDWRGRMRFTDEALRQAMALAGMVAEDANG